MNCVITGSVAFDYLMTFPGYFRDYILTEQLDRLSLSFLVDTLTVQRGGNAANIAFSMALLGEHPHLMATVGEDFVEFRAWLEKNGVDTSLTRVIPGVHTATFFANTDRANSQIASFYPGAMAYAAQLSFHELNGEKPELVTISPNDPGAMQRYARECRELGISYLYDPSQQIVRLDAGVVREGMEGATAFFVNDYELSLVQKTTGMARADILEHVKLLVVTCGENGSLIYTDNDEIHIPIVPALRIVDPTGVGDAFRGGFLVGYGHGWSLETCGQMGALAATYCLENSGPQGQAYKPEEFARRFRQHFDDCGKLDALCEPTGHMG